MDSLYRWNLAPALPLSASEKMGELPRVQKKLLFNRGITDLMQANIYLHQEGALYDPFLLDQMDRAVRLILKKIDEGAKLAVYGDYDVDGVTASALLIQVLTCLGADVRGYIPNRFDEGYGVNTDALQTLKEAGVTLTITVDCGIRSNAEVEFAGNLGMEMILTDHHEPGDAIPAAAAVICPKKPGDSYPDKSLAGVGLSYKLASALLQARPVNGVHAEDWLDFVAIGTVADLVPLVNENRSLVRSGLQKLRVSSRYSVIALAEVSKVRLADINASHIGFGFGPRLNAAGRLETAKLSFDLLMSETLAEARARAIELNDQNVRRQELTRAMQEQVIQQFADQPVPSVICAVDETFNMGVVGLAASRLTEHYYRPSVVGTIDDAFIRASCRSIPEFHITQALNQCADLLERHGGHAMAAGLTVKRENWERLTARLQEIADQALAGKPLQPSKTADMELSLDYLRASLLDEIAQLEPFGYGNPEVVFLVKNLKVNNVRVIGKDQNHLKLSLLSDNQIAIDAVAFRQANRLPELPERIDVICNFEKNTWQDRQTLQLNVIDMRSA